MCGLDGLPRSSRIRIPRPGRRYPTTTTRTYIIQRRSNGIGSDTHTHTKRIYIYIFITKYCIILYYSSASAYINVCNNMYSYPCARLVRPRPSVSPSRCACASVTRVSALQVIVGPPKRNIGFGSFRFPLTRPRFTCRSLIHIIRVLYYYIMRVCTLVYYNRLWCVCVVYRIL